MTYAYFFNNHEFTGGTYRFLVSLFFLKEYDLYLPRNIKNLLLCFTNYIEEEIREDIVEAIKQANELPNYPYYNKKNEILYLRKLNRFIKDPIYYPSENFLFNQFASGKKLSMILQTPIVISWITDRKLRSINDLKYNYYLITYRKLSTTKAIIDLYRLKSYDKKIYLSMSPSNAYEMSLLNIKAKVYSLFPGGGHFLKSPEYDFEREYDLIFFGRPRPEKGIIDVLRVLNVLSRIADRDLKVLFVISNKQELYKYMKNYNIKFSIDIRERVPREELYKLISKSKIFLNPSKSDGFSLSTLEALALGTIVVAYNIPAIRFNYKTPSVIKIKVGKIRDMALKIKELLEDEDLLERLRKDGIEYSRKFKWKVVFENEERLIKRVLRSLT